MNHRIRDYFIPLLHYVPPILWRQAQHWPLPITVSTILMFVASICKLFGASFTMSILFTFVWGWYLLAFIFLTLWSNEDSGVDDIEWN